jgi:hypothetical protein
MHEVNPAGDGRDSVDYVGQVLSRGECMAGVQAEADVVFADRVPQPGQRIEPPRYRIVSARGVLHQDPGTEPSIGRLPGEHLAPVLDTLGGIITLSDMTAVHHHSVGPDQGSRSRVLGNQLARRNADAVVQ